ncbi:MAG: hypothetical protein EYX74_04590 [Desulfobulbaceae bacterium]|nr:MAG: hypothetical protein EYX74_04590 [Desulfobulbaceae bacterium]
MKKIKKKIKGSTSRRSYARLPLTLALGAMVLTPTMISLDSSEAEAAVTVREGTSIGIRGDAEVRGFTRDNTDFDDRTNRDDLNRQIQHRMRIAMDVQAAGGTSLHTRLHLAGDLHRDRRDVWGADRMDRHANVVADYLFVRVPVGDFKITAGRQMTHWGHGLKIDDGTRVDLLQVDHKVDDQTNVFASYQKDIESQRLAPGVNRSDDRDLNRYAIGVVHKTPELQFGVKLRHTDDRRVAQPAVVAAAGEDGQELLAFATYERGDLTTKIEADFGFGDFHESAAGDEKHAVFLGFDYALGDTTLHLNGVWGAHGYRGSGDGDAFERVSMFYYGGDGLAHSGFGGAFGGATDREFGVSFGASHELSPALSLSGRLAHLDGENVSPVGADRITGWNATVLDATMSYRINASTSYRINAIYAKPDFDQVAGATARPDDAYWGLSHALRIRF